MNGDIRIHSLRRESADIIVIISEPRHLNGLAWFIQERILVVINFVSRISKSAFKEVTTKGRRKILIAVHTSECFVEWVSIIYVSKTALNVAAHIIIKIVTKIGVIPDSKI